MRDRFSIRSRLAGGLLLATGGVGFFAAGALHPQPPSDVKGFREAMVAMLADPLWPLAHWIALVTGLVLVLAVWLLADEGWTDGSLAARAGARLVTMFGLFMSVQWAVEIAAHGVVEEYRAGEATPIIDLIDAMQAVGWPGLALGFGLLAAGLPASAPRWIAFMAMIGAAALGFAGILAQALHIVQAGVLFLGGHLLALWMVWAGIGVARSALHRTPRP